MRTVTIKEFGLLQRGGNSHSTSCISIPVGAWDWLFSNTSSTGYIAGTKQIELIKPVKKSGELFLQVMNYCGVLDTPCGLRIEILPKVTNSDSDIPKSRQLLFTMLAAVMNLNFKAFESSSLQRFNRPLIELLIARFLHDVQYMVKRGIRSDYKRQSDELRFLKGQLRIVDQMRQRPGRAHFFHVDYDEYIQDRAENRLIHSALSIVSKWAKSPQNQRLCRELLFTFNEIPKSLNTVDDFIAWKDDRGMAHYDGLKAWCDMILSQQTPLTLTGKNQGLSFLFPMEMLFEKYVGRCLKRQVAAGYQVKEQAASQYLVEHQGQRWFQLKPDFVITNNRKAHVILDTKWKLIDESNGQSKEKYGLSQSDIYQLYAYGEKYLGGEGDVFLIYPAHTSFTAPLEPFYFNDKLTLWAVPFDLDQQCLIVNDMPHPPWLPQYVRNIAMVKHLGVRN